MTRKEARMIAEEMAKVLAPVHEEILDTDGLAKLLHIKPTTIEHNRSKYPGFRVPGTKKWLYAKSKVIEQLVI